MNTGRSCGRRPSGRFESVLPALIAGAGAVGLGGLAYGAFHRNSSLFGPAMARLDAGGREVALTFDDGPNPVATPLILDTLRAERVVATFFLLGKHVERWPALAKRVADEGHVVANHGYHHMRLHLKSRAFIRADLERGTRAIEAATGKRAAHFRAPHGFRNPWVTPIAESLGQRTVGWTLGVWDSARPGAEAIARWSVNGTRPGTILLLHDGDGYDPAGDRTQTAEALPRIIRELRAQSYTFVGLPE